MTATEGIAAMRERYGAGDDAPLGLLTAMLAVQAEAPVLEKDKTAKIPTKTGGEYSYSYADLKGIVEKIGPLLVKHKLVWTAKPSWMQGVGPSLKYKLAYAPTGEKEEDEVSLMLDPDASAQEFGSAVTYMRRYALVAVLNLVAETDDDGAHASAGRGGTALATDKQKKFLRTLITQNRLDAPVTARLLQGAGAPLKEDEKVNDAINRLTRGQCSTLIETIKEGAVPTGESDVPSDASGFVHPPAEMTLEELVGPEVPS